MCLIARAWYGKAARAHAGVLCTTILNPPLAMPAVSQHFLHQSPGDPGFTGQTSLCVVDHRHPHWVVRYDLTRWSFLDEGQATASGRALDRMPTKSRCNDAT